MQQTGKYGQETFQTFTKDINENGLNKTLDSTFGGFSVITTIIMVVIKEIKFQMLLDLKT